MFKGSMSNNSLPSSLAKSSSRSRPVACCKSVGTSPAAAPGPMFFSTFSAETVPANHKLLVIRSMKKKLHQSCGSVLNLHVGAIITEASAHNREGASSKASIGCSSGGDGSATNGEHVSF